MAPAPLGVRPLQHRRKRQEVAPYTGNIHLDSMKPSFQARYRAKVTEERRRQYVDYIPSLPPITPHAQWWPKFDAIVIGLVGSLIVLALWHDLTREAEQVAAQVSSGGDTVLEGATLASGEGD